MLQRIQSLWLLAAAILYGVSFMPNMVFIKTKTAGIDILSDQNLEIKESMITMTGISIAIVLLLIALFMYSKRPVQIIMANLASIVAIIMTVGGSLWICQSQSKFNEIEPGIGAMSTFGAILCIWLATKAIKKDELLVKSMDRLR